MHFTIEELYASKTAKEKGINNKPNMQQMINLVYLAAYVLEPLRVAMNEPIKIGSGFRSRELNAAVGGVYNSQHCKGQAADLCIEWQVVLDILEPFAALLQVAVYAEVSSLSLAVLRVIDATHGCIQFTTAETTAYLDGLVHGDT